MEKGRLTPEEAQKLWSYTILRSCLWFAKGEVIESCYFRDYFTPKAVKDLIADGYIQITPPKK